MRASASAVESLGTTQRFSAALWASPQTATGPAKLAALARLLLPGSPLCLLVGTGLGRLGRRAGQPQPMSDGVRHGLASQAWEPLREVRDLGSLASLGWAVAGRLATAAHRADLADRAERAHHLALHDPRAAPYQLLLVRRSVDHG
jgi:hypothetical protein